MEDYVLQHPETLEIFITELHCLLNKVDPAVKEQKTFWPIVPPGFDADDILRRIREITKAQRVKVTDIRFKADQLAKLRKIPLPKATMNHKEPLMQWFKIHWDELVDDLREWNPNGEGKATGA
jgi:hypothetical protein